MKHVLILIVIAAVSTIGAAPAVAQEAYSAIQNTQFGTSVQGGSGSVAKIDASTRYLNVQHAEVLIIENGKGQRFAWRFDTLYAPTGFPLRKIAPPGFDCGSTWVYVAHSPRRAID